MVGLRPGTRVQREPAVGRAGQRLHRVVHQVSGRALAGQPPQGRRPRRGHVAPAQPGQADDDHVLCRRRRGAGVGRGGEGEDREQAGQQGRPDRRRPHSHRFTVSGYLSRTGRVHVDVTALAGHDAADDRGGRQRGQPGSLGLVRHHAGHSGRGRLPGRASWSRGEALRGFSRAGLLRFNRCLRRWSQPRPRTTGSWWWPAGCRSTGSRARTASRNGRRARAAWLPPWSR